tara:strand:+ start:1218 stop:1385 length:168 start_codon:yes stop_codon:yes gene_type:complete
MTWFYFICTLSLVILISDKKGTLEPAINKFEEKIGIYTPPPDSTESDTLRDESSS